MMTVTVWVYEKNGLKRGPDLTDADFTSYPPNQPYETIEIRGGGPLADPVYQLKIHTQWTIFNLLVKARGHVSDWFQVRDGDNFEARLPRA
jgi:hypothetical protein